MGALIQLPADRHARHLIAQRRQKTARHQPPEIRILQRGIRIKTQSVSSTFIHVVFRVQFGSQGDFLFDGFFIEDFQGGIDGFRAARRVLERGGQNAVLDVPHAFGGQAIDADEFDLLFAAFALLSGRLVRAVRAGIVVAVDGVNLGIAWKGRRPFPAARSVPATGSRRRRQF